MKAKDRASARRRLTPWVWFAASVLLCLGIAALLEIIAYERNQRLDLTPAEDFTLSEQTQKVLRGLKREVEFVTFYKGGDRARHEEFYRLLRISSPRVKYRLVHLDGNPAQAKMHGVTTYGQTLVKLGGQSLLISQPSEEKVLNALVRLTSGRVKTMLFSQGHGEQDPKGGFSALAKALGNEGWRVETVNLALREPPADPLAVLLVAAPRRDFLELEIRRLEEFLKQGGNLIFLFEPFSQTPRLEAFLAARGMALGRDIILDQTSKILGDDGLAPLIPLFAKGPITEALGSPAVFPSAGSITMTDAELNQETQYLAMSAKTSWATSRKSDLMKGGIAFQKGVDRQGPLPVAGLTSLKKPEGAEKPGGGLALFGDSDFLSNSFLEVMANKDLFLNTANWLVKDQILISVRKPQYRHPRRHMTHSQTTWVFVICVVLLPLAAMLAGGLVLGYRKWRG